MDNIVLIGAPGCGKSTMARLIAEKLQLPIFDVDDYIEKREGKSIKDIFINGEEYFRNVESIALEEIVKKVGKKVIATGGGAVKVDKNMELFISNAVILFINRPLEQIATDVDVSNRPLLSRDPSKLFTLYKERYPLYKKYCHYEVKNDKSINETLDEIIHFLERY